ncbi:site-specific integrase [uncultured Sphaerochaeta sp.]|uniref:tyrosine-type recombinase/integrase n=1 Tax=uncultured Sphaerochaeta sp. TaxID=886478 RepID=UPI002627F619|nr:site-specific integrase [uncultured Sphaerochaeta sp.]
MRAREPFTLYKRKLATKVVFYYVAYDDQGKRRKFSTGCTTKSQALAYTMELYKTNSLIPVKKEPVVLLTFGVYAKGWWTPDCDYVKAEALRGRKLTAQYINTNKRSMEKHILPTFRSSLLTEITSAKIKAWQRYLIERKKLSTKYANNILSIFSVILDEARREGHIKANPAREVRAFANNSKQRGILSFEEARDLLTNLSYWDNPIAYTASLLAACTGMRVGEIRALRPCDLRDGYIHVEHSVDLQGALKGTKTGDNRDLPLPQSLMDALRTLADHAGKEGRIFSVAGVPMSTDAIRDSFYRAMAVKGITEEERRERNITFHSWRHFLNSQLLANGINESKTRKIIGHSTAGMTKRYAHFLVNDFADVLEITESILHTQIESQ